MENFVVFSNDIGCSLKQPKKNFRIKGFSGKIPKAFFTMKIKHISLLKTLSLLLCLFFFAVYGSAQTKDEKAEAVLKKAVQTMGGDNYLKVKTQIGRGKFSLVREGMIGAFQSFVDVIVFPDKERTEFKEFGRKSVQTNSGDTGWIFDGTAEVINVQSETQVADFKRGINASLDNFLRQQWRGKAVLSYVGRREATLGTRNDVVKLTYEDGFAVEFEFSAEGLPVKSIYKRTNPDGVEQKQEDRYAQFVDVQGIKTPFIIDHFSGGIHTSRINYETVEYNKPVPDSIFAKPNTPKEAKKDLKL